MGCYSQLSLNCKDRGISQPLAENSGSANSWTDMYGQLRSDTKIECSAIMATEARLNFSRSPLKISFRNYHARHIFAVSFRIFRCLF